MRVTVGFKYVLVLEWLSGADARTGSQLHALLPSVGFRSEFVECPSGEDVRRALANAAAQVQTEGAPIVHLEAHGSDPWKGEAENLCFGPGKGPGVTWAQLGEWLAPLNTASGFQLLCVSAACWGSGIMGGISGGMHPAPFSCAVGFRTEVGEGRLRDAVKELYRALKSGDELPECVARAQRELIEGQEIRLEVALELAIKILHGGFFRRAATSPIGPHRRRRRARGVWDSWFPRDLQERDPAYRFESAWNEVLKGAPTSFKRPIE